MLARPGPLPTPPGWAFEPKWDGFRAIVRTGSDYRVRSRRGWDMTSLLPEFARIPVGGIFDGELVSLDHERRPSFQRLCGRMLGADRRVPVSLIVFDVLEHEDASTMRLSYLERRELLESLDFGGACTVGERFDDGDALWQAVLKHRLEGVVAERLAEPYRPGGAVVGEAEQPGLATI
jgi:bifunctional non-homologous end joining protein LigD